MIARVNHEGRGLEPIDVRRGVVLRYARDRSGQVYYRVEKVEASRGNVLVRSHTDGGTHRMKMSTVLDAMRRATEEESAEVRGAFGEWDEERTRRVAERESGDGLRGRRQRRVVR